MAGNFSARGKARQLRDAGQLCVAVAETAITEADFLL